MFLESSVQKRAGLPGTGECNQPWGHKEEPFLPELDRPSHGGCSAWSESEASGLEGAVIQCGSPHRVAVGTCPGGNPPTGACGCHQPGDLSFSPWFPGSGPRALAHVLCSRLRALGSAPSLQLWLMQAVTVWPPSPLLVASEGQPPPLRGLGHWGRSQGLSAMTPNLVALQWPIP